MTTSAGRLLLILAVIAVVGGAFVMLRTPSTPADGGLATRPGGAGQTSRQGNPVGDLKLESLERRNDARSTPSRDVFRFEERRVEAAPPRPRPRQPVEQLSPPVPTGPPPPPPIPLRYIGYLDEAGEAPRVAVLSDGRGNVFNGKEGDVIEGRYRVLRIGNDSADLIYVDGRGRQTIRLSGQ
jgi:hypothetical protein